MTRRFTSLPVLMATTLLLGLVAVGTALAVSSDGGEDIGSRLNARAAGQSAPAPVASVPDELSAIFRPLDGPAVTSVPPSVTRMARATVMDALGLNPALTHAVQPPASDPATRWFIVPGVKAACLALGSNETAATCTTPDRAAKTGLVAIALAAPVRLDANGRVVKTPGPSQATFRGVAPAGTVAIEAVTRNSAETSRTDVSSDGAYRLSATGATRLDFVQADGTRTSLPLPG